MRWRILICIANEATESLPRGTAFLLWLHISLILGEAYFFSKEENFNRSVSVECFLSPLLFEKWESAKTKPTVSEEKKMKFQGMIGFTQHF